MKHKFDERADSMHEILQHVRLPLLRPQFLADVVQTDVCTKSCLKCRDLVDKAKDYHLMPDRRYNFLFYVFLVNAYTKKSTIGIVLFYRSIDFCQF